MEEITININIADRPYRLTIDRADEEIVRKAAQTINDQMRDYARHFAYKDKQDLLSMVAIQYAISSLKNESELAFRDHHLTDKLKAIDELLSTHSND
jgi:cell division protein ZapA